MKFDIQRSLFAQMLRRISGAVQKSSGPGDLGRYITIKVSKNKISATVVRDDCVANSTIDAALVNDDDFLRIEKEGVVSVNGDSLLKTILDTEINGMVSVEFKDMADCFNSKESEDADKDETKEKGVLAAVGALLVKQPGLKGSQEEVWLQSVSIKTPSSISWEDGTAATIAASDFADYVQKVGTCAGKGNQSVEHSHVQIRSIPEKDSIEMATFDGQRLAWTIFPVKAAGNFSILAPYDLVASNVRLLVPEHDVFVCKPDSSPDGIVLSQHNYLSEKIVGRTIYKLYAMTNQFANFQKTISQLDFKYSCKVSADNFRHIAKRLGVVGSSRTHISLVEAKKEMIFSKGSDNVRSKDIVLPLESISGGDLELEMSSGFLKDAANIAGDDDIEILFSGKYSLVKMSLSPTVRIFMQPFGKV